MFSFWEFPHVSSPQNRESDIEHYPLIHFQFIPKLTKQRPIIKLEDWTLHKFFSSWSVREFTHGISTFSKPAQISSATIFDKIATDFHCTERSPKEMTVAFVDIGARSAMQFATADLCLFLVEIESVFRWAYK
jgi:hypothetical protein